MRILVTGATGFIGRALVPLLQAAGHTVIASTRSESRARNLLGADVEIVPSDMPVDDLARLLSVCDGVVNLAGEPLIGRRWTARRREVLEASRVDTTRRLVAAISEATHRPGVLVSASAVGVYGDRGAEPLTEESALGTGYLATLCRDWETAAADAASHGVRVVLLRTGIVLGQGGGALAAMLPAFKVGAGGPIGSGQQYVPWIHLRDAVRIIAAALIDARYSGPLNLAAPGEATSKVFARTLGRTLHRPALVPAPALALRLVFGEAATVLLSSQRVRPDALAALGFSFDFPTLDRALDDILHSRSAQLSSSHRRSCSTRSSRS